MSSRRVPVLLAFLVALSSIASPAVAQQASFNDVSGSPHAPAVSALADEGLINGCDDGRYCPDRQLTRGQVASILASALGLELPVEATTEELTSRFSDTAGSVHRLAIEAIAEAGVTNGCEEGRFCPGEPISRGELATLLVKALDVPAATNGPHFTDVAGVHGSSIDALAENGLAAGCSLVRFCATAPLSRAHAATFIARGLDLVPLAQLAPFAERRAEHDAREAAEAEARARAAAEAEARALAPGRKAVEVATAQVGKPYQWGGNGPASFDCSGLTRYAWRAAGVDLPRTSRDQHAGTRRISRSDLRPGDLVFYYSPVGHVAMYIGDGKVVEAPSSGRTVRISSTGLSRSGIVGYGRPA